MQGSDDGSPIRALLVVSRFYGLMAFWIVKLWPRVTKLNPADRVAVLRAVNRGEDIGNARLAHDVIDCGRAVRAALSRSRLFRLLVWPVIVIALALGVEIALGLSGLSLVAPVLAVAFGVFYLNMATLPRQLDKVGRAERAAHHLLEQQRADEQ